MKDAATSPESGPDSNVSTLNLIFPEVFLADDDRINRIENIHCSMQQYADSGVFAAPHRGFVYIERDTPFNCGRKGLVAAIDLERYDWSPGSRSLIRSTEGTIPERLPARMDLRRNALIETSHVLLLIDDESDSFLQNLGERVKQHEPEYQGMLMLNSGKVSGWFLDKDSDFAFIGEKLEKMAQKALSCYAASDPAAANDEPFLFAVGDGNHSLAGARGIWDEYKQKHKNSEALQHPCRYALVEIVNIYDPAIQFEPIHRVIFGLGFDEILAALSALPDFSVREIADRNELVRLVRKPVNGNCFGILAGSRCALLETSASGVSTVCLQPLLDQILKHDSTVSIDYIHGEDELFRLACADSVASGIAEPVTGILLPPIHKAGFFATVARSGPLPRKSFSMGQAEEKRFYIECRKLFF